MSEARAILVDDEPELTGHMQRLLAQAWPALELVPSAHDGVTALETIEHWRPDVAFLDIRMPGMSGMEIVRRIKQPCHIVFVTAYDDYAVEAFEREAVDYLLKPVAAKRREYTVARLKEKLASRPPDLASLIERLGAQITERAAPLSWLRVARGEQVRVLSVDDVVYFQTGDKYTSVFTTESEYLLRKPLSELVQELDPERFWQIHRRTVVNMSGVWAAEREFGGRMLLTLKSRPERLRVSRRYAARFRQL